MFIITNVAVAILSLAEFVIMMKFGPHKLLLLLLLIYLPLNKIYIDIALTKH